MRNAIRSAATAVFAFAAFSSSANAAPTIDGTVGLGEYGAPTATVLTDPAAPTSNFGAPTGAAKAGYNVFLTDTNDTLYGAIQQSGGVADGSFANLYFDIDPTTGSGGSEFGVEVTNLRGFVAGVPNSYFDLAPYINYSILTDAGLTTVEFSIANSAFRDFIAGAGAMNYFGPGGYVSQDVRLNLSQSLSYSVAGGPTYESAGLGRFSVAAAPAVPEPATWLTMILGMGAVGYSLRRRRSAAAVLQTA